mmetsp:Transcript_15543/g.48930  ORF Transcript_15543/g.48930 Transcript_15543/m.48930 type:complete len:213 (+) Transcript_15543:231-869(+)
MARHWKLTAAFSAAVGQYSSCLAADAPPSPPSPPRRSRQSTASHVGASSSWGRGSFQDCERLRSSPASSGFTATPLQTKREQSPRATRPRGDRPWRPQRGLPAATSQTPTRPSAPVVSMCRAPCAARSGDAGGAVREMLSTSSWWKGSNSAGLPVVSGRQRQMRPSLSPTSRASALASHWSAVTPASKPTALLGRRLPLAGTQKTSPLASPA